MAGDETNAEEKVDDGVVELPAPDGWKKKLTPRKSRATRRNDIVFISPTGDEVKSKRHLDQYLKSHPGEPPASEFDWSTGETPRRSGRISEKVKAAEAPENEPPPKRSSTKTGSKAKKDDADVKCKDLKEGEDAAVDKGNEKSELLESSEGKGATEKNAGEVSVEEPVQPAPEETGAHDSKREQIDDCRDIPMEVSTDEGREGRLAEPEASSPGNEGHTVKVGLEDSIDIPMEVSNDEGREGRVSEPEAAPVNEGREVKVGLEEQIDMPIEVTTDEGTENRLAEPEAAPGNEGQEVKAGLDVNQDDVRVEIEIQPADNPKCEIDVTEKNLAASKPEVPGNDTVAEKGFSEDASS